MSKRGQVTVFIILGIVILALFGMLIFFRGELFEVDMDDQTNRRFTSPDIEPVKEVVKECVEITLLDSIEWVSNRGGYFSPIGSDSYSKSSGDFLITYAWHFQHGTRLPSLVGLGEQINLYMTEHRDEIEDCIDSKIGEYQRSWNVKNINSFVLEDPLVSENMVKQKIKYSSSELLTIQKDDYAASASEILSELDIALGQTQRMAADIAGCFNGDFNHLSDSFNTFCNVDGVPFRASLYNMRYHSNVVSLLHNNCNPDCDDCYVLRIPVEGGDITFNVVLKTC